MATSPFRRMNSDVPGPTGYHYYGAHDYEHLFVWRPAGSFVNKPLVVYIHGGLGFNPGNRAMAIDDPGGSGICTEIYNQLGWPLVSIDYPPCASNALPKWEVCNTMLWPGMLFSVARAIQHLKSNADGTTEYGELLWGAGNSINPHEIVIVGDSFGGTLGSLLGLIPAGVIPTLGPTPLAFSNYAQEFDHRPRAVIVQQGQMDWTQFSLQPAPAALGDVYDNNIHQVFMYDNTQMVWGKQYNPAGAPTNPPNQLPMRIKKDASPWWWLIQNHAANRNVAFYLAYPAGNIGAYGANLTPADWNPGVQLLDEASGKAFYDPHHRYQALPTATKMRELGILQVRAVWGNYAGGSGSNSGGGDFNGWNVGQDVVAANAGSTRADVVATLRDRWLIGQS